MNDQQLSYDIVLRKSPIELIIVGAKGKRNGVLVRTEDAQIDLIGFAIDDVEKLKNNSSSSFLFLLAPKSERKMNSVDSYPIAHSNDQKEQRKSDLRLSWVGLCSNKDREEISSVFQKYAADLQSGLEDNNIEQVELSLSPIIYHCQVANQRVRRQRQSAKLIIGLYILLALVMFVLFALKDLSKP
jgi:hypothetical protein